MTTGQRVGYLTHWQQYASKFFGDQTLAEQVVTDDEVATGYICQNYQTASTSLTIR